MYLPTRSESICAHTDLYVNVHSRLLCVILKCAKGQSIHQQMNEQKHSGIFNSIGYPN